MKYDRQGDSSGARCALAADGSVRNEMMLARSWVVKSEYSGVSVLKRQIRRRRQDLVVELRCRVSSAHCGMRLRLREELPYI